MGENERNPRTLYSSNGCLRISGRWQSLGIHQSIPPDMSKVTRAAKEQKDTWPVPGRAPEEGENCMCPWGLMALPHTELRLMPSESQQLWSFFSSWNVASQLQPSSFSSFTFSSLQESKMWVTRKGLETAKHSFLWASAFSSVKGERCGWDQRIFNFLF